MITAQGLTKTYGHKVAVNNASFTVQPGKVTGFLGPNGAGKSTTMRMIVGLDRPQSGNVTINGQAYASLRAPLHEVGALLDAKGVHPGRSARSHLRAIAATHRIPESRIDEVLELTGLTPVAGKRVGGFSLGMGQRLGIAAALLGDPRVLILDEPVNGLDVDGVMWVRSLLRGLADEGRTVLLSSHLMSEMAQIADHVIVIAQGEIIADAPLSDLLQAQTQSSVSISSPDAARLASVVMQQVPDAIIEHTTDHGFAVRGVTAPVLGSLAFQHGVELHELTPHVGQLEAAYLSLTQGTVEYSAADSETPAAQN
ncbi:ABC transporter ATP-binding protein [Microbacterium sp. YY-01]|uniref:ABC transporter ATP-binding protein n=1 Tax=Microbacterium sp. YY-01 TaxID=3421634 RepID=UPI003D185ED5